MTFAWHDDPNSTFGTSHVSQIGLEGNLTDSITYNHFDAVNTGQKPLADVGVFIPFAWARIGNPDGSLNHYESLMWDNGRMGFIDSNFNGTGKSVLLTISIANHQKDTTTPHSVLAGSVADQTDMTPFPQSSVDAGIPLGTGTPIGTRPLETFHANDLLPFADLGRIATGQSQRFDVTWTAHWDGRENLGAVRVAFSAFTLAPDRLGSTVAAAATQSDL